jgi:dethiobiotin synthetase
MKGLFITGTDTGVGKTTVAVGLTRLLRRQGLRVQVSKPVATGARETGGRWISEDTLALAEAAGQNNFEQITPWSFPEPVAPPVAVRLHGRTLNLSAIAAAVRRQDRPDAVVLVEGVGGLLCPLTETETIADLAKAVGLPLLVVARRSLGTLNHTLLTLEAARTRGLRLAGVLINETEPCRDLAAESNVEELRRRMNVPLLAVVPHGGDVAKALAKVDWQQFIA